jgi:hypothetical protein
MESARLRLVEHHRVTWLDRQLADAARVRSARSFVQAARHLLIGSIELLGVLSTELHVHGGFWSFMANFNINKAGFAVAGLFVLVWLAAVSYWKLGRVEQKWAGAAEAVEGSV